ncbi:MAG: hypothetical protein SNJ54_08515 [Anaerolineae bacterium]
MSIVVGWDNNDSDSRLLLFTWSGSCTWHDCKEALTQAELLAHDTNLPAVHLFDLTASELSQQALMPLLQKCLAMRLSYRVRKTIFIERPHLVGLLNENLRLALGDALWSTILITDSLPRARALSAMN